jgi:hypothetical protein
VPTEQGISILGNDSIAPVSPRSWYQTKKRQTTPESPELIGNGDDLIASKEGLVFTYYYKAIWEFRIDLVTQAKLSTCFRLKRCEAKDGVCFVPDNKQYRASAEATHAIKQDDRSRGDAHCW